LAAQAPLALLGAIKSRFADDADCLLNRTIQRCIKRDASLHAQRPEGKKAA
jgi:hypothetical protein